MPDSVMAAPNRSRITAVCLSVSQAPSSPRKWLLRLAVRSVEQVYGGAFVRPGDEVDAFTIGDTPGVDVGTVLVAPAEYVGDARHGVFGWTKSTRSSPGGPRNVPPTPSEPRLSSLSEAQPPPAHHRPAGAPPRPTASSTSGEHDCQ